MSAFEREARRDLDKQKLVYKLLSVPLAGLYRAVTVGRRAVYDRGLAPVHRLPGVTIAVGNIVAGGTGKTPVVLELARLLCVSGARPAILTRGYGGGLRADEGLILRGGAVLAAWGRSFASLRMTDTVEVTPVIKTDDSPVIKTDDCPVIKTDDCPVIKTDDSGSVILSEAKDLLHPSMIAAHPRLPDEAMLLSQALPDVPILVGADRLAAAAQFARLNEPQPTHWLLDDGFQHRRIARDLDLVLLDARQPFGNGALLPRGLLREPPSSLARATAVLFTRAGGGFPSETTKRAVAAFCSAPAGEARFITDVPPVPAPEAGPILLAAGIADPERLRAAVESALGRRVFTHFVPDHADFDGEALKTAAQAAAFVLTTPKDHWRDPAVFAACARPVGILGLRLEGAREFLQKLLGNLPSAGA